MKLGIAMVGSMAFVCLCTPALKANEPKDKTWHLVQSEISLGKLTKDQAVPVTFEVRNDQDVPLMIISTDVTCRCTSLTSAPDEVPPHSSGIFRWTFNASRSSGSVEDTVSITGDDGRTLIGTFKAFVSESSPTPHLAARAVRWRSIKTRYVEITRIVIE